MILTQEPSPGTCILKHRGDCLRFTLILDQPCSGDAFLRTNLGHASIARDEIIQQVDRRENPLGRDWFDIPMRRRDETSFQINLPMVDVGHFEAKAFFIQDHTTDPKWPSGPNIIINVEPACTCCANTLYNAFVRQFGPNKSGRGAPDEASSRHIQMLDQAGYTVIPPSGTFRDLIEQLDFIIGRLGCRWIQLLPIHPTPTTYARMGRFGSPYAALSFTAIDPALAQFDPRATPLEQFIELVDAVHARRARIIIDIAINHTGWAAGLHETHPEWLKRGDDGRIQEPGAWGVVWADLTALDFSHETLWQYMADVFLTWCARGVDGFRCDAGYMIPAEAWRYIIARVRKPYPDTLFLLEGLGGKIAVTEQLLDRSGFNWAYSELFQNYDRGQIEYYLPEPIRISHTKGLTVHFAETHDNNRLASVSFAYARMRTALCALLSIRGGFAFANGVEWLATEKINVHDANSLNWGAQPNQVDHIRRLNMLLKEHPVFYDDAHLEMVHQGQGNHIALLRHHAPSGKKLLIAANLDSNQESLAQWSVSRVQIGHPLTDLISGQALVVEIHDDFAQCVLKPLEIVCLSEDPNDMEMLEQKLSGNGSSGVYDFPDRMVQQHLRAKVIDVWRHYYGLEIPDHFDLDQACRELAEEPIAFCRRANLLGDEPRVTTWRYPRDQRREVMLPPGHFLLIEASAAFRAAITYAGDTVAGEESFLASQGRHLALFKPLPTPGAHQTYWLNLTLYKPDQNQHIQAPLLALTRFENTGGRHVWTDGQLKDSNLLFLAANGRGAMLRAAVDWGHLPSRYDALLAANLNPHHPEDRWIMFTRCRAWIVYQDFSQEIRPDCLDGFCFDHDNQGVFRYKIPTGRGQHIFLTIRLEMGAQTNAMRMRFHRHSARGDAEGLEDDRPVRLILRPDIEDRNFHQATKAYTGPERAFPDAVVRMPDGFDFRPHPERCLQVKVDGSQFVWQPEWHYMVYHPLEATRGLDPYTDLFSPGYFTLALNGGQTIALTAQIHPIDDVVEPEICFDDALINETMPGENSDWPLLETLTRSLNHYVVRRDPFKTIIAGYPWFLDWGRDALIVTRGLIAAGRFDDARAVLKQFGKFEQTGTLPNMIHGDNAANRDTSDAPLWFGAACRELLQHEKSECFLDDTCGQRSVRDLLLSIGNHLWHGAPNGVYADNASGLLFSPGHFTWMDTNYPAGTPRQGYPIEIQALWQYFLSFLAEIAPPQDQAKWREQARKVRAAIIDLFWMETEGYLADCLHAPSGTPAMEASKDDALRCNQLLAITLEAVTDPALGRRILAVCQELLVPGAIRSLADRPVRYPHAIVHNGHQINDPRHPYQGRYEGDEDTQRKPAYHNGTAWTWPFPSYAEAWVKIYGASGVETALAWLGSSSRIINNGCVGHVPEILDGDYPHKARGCDAQAWGVSELARVLLKLEKYR